MLKAMSSVLQETDASLRDTEKSEQWFIDSLEQLSPAGQRAAEGIRGVEGEVDKLVKKGSGVGNFFKNIGLSLLNSLAFTAATVALSWVYENIIKYQEKQEEKLKNLQSEYNDISSAIESLNGQYDDNISRIAELNGLKGSSDWTSELADELKALEDENEALKIQIERQEKLLDIKARQTDAQAVKTLGDITTPRETQREWQSGKDSGGSSGFIEGGTVYGSGRGTATELKNAITQLESYNKAFKNLNEQYNKGEISGELYQKQFGQLVTAQEEAAVTVTDLTAEVEEQSSLISDVDLKKPYDDLVISAYDAFDAIEKVRQVGTEFDADASGQNLIDKWNSRFQNVKDNTDANGMFRAPWFDSESWGDFKQVDQIENLISQLQSLSQEEIKILFTFDNVAGMSPEELLEVIGMIQGLPEAAASGKAKLTGNFEQSVGYDIREYMKSGSAGSQDITTKDFAAIKNEGGEAWQFIAEKANYYDQTAEDVYKQIQKAGYGLKDFAGEASSFDVLKDALSSILSETQTLDDAIVKLGEGTEPFSEWISTMDDSGKYANLDSLLTTFPQLKDEILAYNDAIAAGGDKLVAQTKLQHEMNDALNQFRADKLVEGVENIASAAETYGKNSHSVIEAIEELDSIIPGLSNTLIDENGVLRDNAIAALTSADGLLACVEANKSLGLAAAQLDLSNAKKQLDDLGTSASMAAIRLAESAVITAQLNLDKTKESIEAMLGNVGKPKSSGKSSKDHLLESYQAEIARLDHLREMDQINEATYYNDKLAALQTYLKDRKKYQEQWWAWEEEFHNYQKQLIEDEIDQLEDQRGKQIDTNEEYYKNLKKQKEKEYDLEKDRVDKVIDALEKEEDAKKKAIQKQRDLLDEQADDRDYNKSIEQKNKKIADIKAQLTVLDLDDSAEAKAKKIALQEELTDKLNDLEDYQYDHSIDTQKSALDKQETYWEDHFSKLIEAQELYLENLKTMYDQTIESIESSMEAMTNSIKASFDSLIAAQQSLLDNAGSIPGMAEITPIGGGSGDDKSGSNEYKVKEGDNLSRIAKAKGTSVSKLLELNPWIKDKNKIYPGQIIKYHDGGVVGKSINDKDKEVLSQLIPVSRDEVLAKLLRGEVVVNEKQQGLMRDAWMSIAPSMALATKQADMAKALASNVTTNNSPNIVFDMKIEVGNTDAAGLTALQRQLENFKNEAVKAVYERMSNHRQKTGRINPSGRY